MKKLIYILLITSTFITTTSIIQAQPYNGGEVGWECQQNGKYIFYLKAYRDCAGPIFSSTQTLSSNSPLTSISLTLVSGYPKEISPICNADTNYFHISCSNLPPYPQSYNSGAITEYLWKSDTIALLGIPPASGWIFHWTSACRLPSSNISNSYTLGYSLRAIMYPNGGKNAYPCYDNSPSFAEPPRTIIPKGNSSFSYYAIDNDMDSLVYNWGIPWSAVNQPITNYFTGYSHTSPLPNSNFNTNNIAATLDSETGILETTVFNNGAYVICVNVKSFRKGILIADVYRESQLVVFDSITTNTAPQISGNIDTIIFVGDAINLTLSATDFQFLPLGAPQEIKMKFVGQQFGSYIPPSGSSSLGQFDSIGCANPPCAQLNPAPAPGEYLSGQFGLATNFIWQTECDHISEIAGGNGYENKFYFIINTQDDFCPVPAVSAKKIKIHIKDRAPLPSVDSLWVDFDYMNYNSVLEWTPAQDSNNQFISYNVYYSSNALGPYALVDSIININTTQSIINTGLVNEAYFYIIVKSHTYCNNIPQYTDSTTTAMILTDIIKHPTDEIFQLLTCKPNPAKENTIISFRLKHANKAIFQLTDLQGKVLDQQIILATKGINRFQQNLENLEAGIYFYSIEVEGLKKIGKLIVW